MIFKRNFQWNKKHMYGKFSTFRVIINKANLRDLVAVAGLVTLFGQRDFETAWMIVKNNHLQMKIISYQINPAEMKAIVPGIHYPFVLKWFDHQINDLP